MIELLLWILAGSLSGWIGYLLARTNSIENPAPYFLWGIIAAVCGGLFVKATDPSAGIYSINANSLIFALMTSATCLTVISILGSRRVQR